MVAEAACKPTPCKVCKMDGAKLCTTASVMVERKKNAKHHHTTGSCKKANEDAGAAPTGARLPLTAWVCKNARWRHNTSNTTAYNATAASMATRQWNTVANVTKLTGASAQPRLPARPWALKA